VPPSQGFGQIRILAAFLFAAFAAGLPAAAQQGQMQGQARAPNAVRLQLKWYHQFQFAGYYIALEKGWYAEEGLSVSIVEADASTRVNRELAEGRAEYGVNASDTLLDRAAGVDLVALGAIFQHSPLVVLATAPDIKAPDSLAGKSIMVSEGADTEVLSMLLNESVRLDSVRIVEHSWRLDDLTEGRVDAITAYSTNEALVLKERGIPFTMIRPLVYGIDFYGDCLIATGKEVRDHPERASAFLRASLRGWEYAMDNKEEAARLIVSRYSQKKSYDQLMAEAMAMDELIVHRFIPLGAMNPGRWRHIADTYARLGVLPLDFNLEGFIYDPDNHEAETRYLRRLSLWFGGAAFLIGAASLALFAFNRRLAHEVKARTISLVELNSALQAEIAERLAKERALAASIDEKSILLRELHHRVKNNLQVIMSLISMEMDKKPGAEAMNQLKQIRGRVYSMALVHERLYEQGDLAAVDAASYLSTLTNEVIQLFTRPELYMNVNFDIEQVKLPIEQAIPLGLIIGELVSNSMKHAFSGQERGTVSISLRERAGNCTVEVKDDGRGMAPAAERKTDYNLRGGLGLVLVEALAHQLGGSLGRGVGEGYSTLIVFPLRREQIP
jgi:two-component sensor histidine kinase/ABC-type nitrate/sulfonate/bicarbonate transport system substrate-binding protein